MPAPGAPYAVPTEVYFGRAPRRPSVSGYLRTQERKDVRSVDDVKFDVVEENRAAVTEDDPIVLFAPGTSVPLREYLWLVLAFVLFALQGSVDANITVYRHFVVSSLTEKLYVTCACTFATLCAFKCANYLLSYSAKLRPGLIIATGLTAIGAQSGASISAIFALCAVLRIVMSILIGAVLVLLVRYIEKYPKVHQH